MMRRRRLGPERRRLRLGAGNAGRPVGAPAPAADAPDVGRGADDVERP